MAEQAGIMLAGSRQQHAAKVQVGCGSCREESAGFKLRSGTRVPDVVSGSQTRCAAP